MMLTILEKRFKHLQTRRKKKCHKPGGEGVGHPTTKPDGRGAQVETELKCTAGEHRGQAGPQQAGQEPCGPCGPSPWLTVCTCWTGLRNIQFAAGLASTLLHDAHSCLPFAAKAAASLLPACRSLGSVSFSV